MTEIHIPQTPPKATTAEETDRLIKEQAALWIDKYLSIMNESGGELVPYLFAELPEYTKKHPEINYTNNSMITLLFEGIANQEPDALEVLNRARKHLKSDKKLENLEKAREKQQKELQAIPNENARRIKYNNSDTFTFVKDSFSNTVFSRSCDIKMENGRPTLYAVYRSREKNKKAVKLKSVFTYDYEYLKAFNIMDASIDPGYDRAVCTVCDNLYLNCNNRVSLSKMLKEMGIRYSQKEAAKLLNTLRKLKAINLIVDNKAVLELYGIGERYQEIDRAFLPIAIINDRVQVNGNIAETTIEILGFSPFWLVADPISQKTEYEKELFTLYEGRRTSKYWRVIIHLMNEISYLRGGGRSSKFLLSSIYEDIGDEDTRQKASTKKLVYELLEQVFKPLGYIDNYTPSDDKEFFIVTWSKSSAAKQLKEPKKGGN